MASQVNSALPTPPSDPTSLAPGNYTSTIILNRIFSLLLTMITSLQNVAAAQANNLNFMSQWQTAYTNAMSQMHTFIQGDGNAFSANSSAAAMHRSDLNTLNSNLLQTMQNRQAVVSNNAKTLQSNVDQSNDAVNQQSSLGTAILQELSTLTAALYPS
jgi:DMSO reductase anchor subunit